MLYVFHVDTGTMLTFDMNLATERVLQLQEAIQLTYKISVDKQVLLISGGESLDPTAKVGSYSSGTDTNPIFLFSKSSIESATPPSASVNYGSELAETFADEADLKEQVEGSHNMPDTYETVVARAQLALQFHDVGKDEFRICEKLVHDQHLQHQGWAAVIANLEDITSAFRERYSAFQGNFEEYLSNRDSYAEVLEKFPTTVDLLGKIPLLPCLMVDLSKMDLSGSRSASSSMDVTPNTLLHWITAQDSRSSLEHMIQQCHQGLEQFTDIVKGSLQTEVNALIEAINNPNMKEVKGLEDRLYGLEQLLFGARKIISEQQDMAQGFVANQNRARNLADKSVLPDLCTSHRRQLLVMLKNHQSLRDIKRRCTAAKEELSANLHTRLRWVMYVEKSICDMDSKLMIHRETLKKLKRKLEIIHQMHEAPSIYALSVVEVVRRKMFSGKFLEWAGTLAEDCKQLHDSEVEKRTRFSGRLRRHFLNTLFPGFEDLPPPYAKEAPSQFDSKLPPITGDDVEYLREQVPELAPTLTVPNSEEVLPGFSSITLRGASSTILVSEATSPIQSETSGATPPSKLTKPSLSHPGALSPTNKGFQKNEMAASDIVVLDSNGEISKVALTKDVVASPDDEEGPVPQGKQTVVTPSGVMHIPFMTYSKESSSTSKTQSDTTVTGENARQLSPGATDSTVESVEVLEEDEDEEPTSGEYLSFQGEVNIPPALDGATLLGLTTITPQGSSDTLSSSTTPPVIRKADLKLLQADASVTASASSPQEKAKSITPTSDKQFSESSSAPAHQKTTSETSPELSSEGFSTADFYIDESLPSSMTDSPPYKKIQELQALLNDKISMLDSKEKELVSSRGELEEVKEKLEKASDQFRTLHDLAEKGALQIKCDVLSMAKQAQKDKDEFQEYMEAVTLKLTEVIAAFEKEQTRINEETVQQLKDGHDKEVSELKEKLETEAGKLIDVQNEVEVSHNNCKELSDKYDALKEETDSRFQELEQKCETEVQSAKSQLMLEHEVELEKVRSDLEIEVSTKEQEVIKLKENIEELEQSIEGLKKEKEKLHETLQQQFQEEKDQIVKVLEEEYIQKKEELEKELRGTISAEHQEQIQRIQAEHSADVQSVEENLASKQKEVVNALREELEEKHKEALEAKEKQVRDDMHKQNEQMQDSFEESHKQQLEELRIMLHKEHETRQSDVTSQHQMEMKSLREFLETEQQQKIEELQSRLEVLERENTELKAGSEMISQETHAQLLSEMGAAHEEELSQVVAKALAEANEQHLSAMAELQKDKDNSLQSLKTSVTAEKQVVFNEALTKVVAEKDKRIDVLQEKEAHLQADSDKYRGQLSDVLSGRSNHDQEREMAISLAEDRRQEISSIKTQHEAEITSLRQQIMTLSAVTGSSQSCSSLPVPLGVPNLAQSMFVQSHAGMGQSVVSIPESASSTVMMESRLKELELTVKGKDEELTRLSQKLMSLSMSPSHRSLVQQQDKVSITRCDVGDIVLLCLDERHDHYVVFNMGNILHFLHSDCLENLGLKIGVGESRKSWVLAEIIDKEYCQAKKPQNRFKVPVGTKFYRVKAKPWDREAALQASAAAATAPSPRDVPVSPTASPSKS